jgi:hypothetical protein
MAVSCNVQCPLFPPVLDNLERSQRERETHNAICVQTGEHDQCDRRRSSPLSCLASESPHSSLRPAVCSSFQIGDESRGQSHKRGCLGLVALGIRV